MFASYWKPAYLNEEAAWITASALAERSIFAVGLTEAESPFTKIPDHSGSVKAAVAD